ncbi:DNA-binding transcriptional LysR family regulator [Devosia subaequoris]|uniref:DNA-binding transcriptional LysR family regulator n=1 Tax=Devosia subaequoris TaxID=395930 RepID=A0A7W6IQK3_9HYPH|nr:LysR family transcriptional regulator [Devosia subaequoris]MBB4053245.1 DNA-binding transcriptional LysR family regulator [Devosia subaequoris]MCP1210624.1 LysR family transcriptional regulator [Devosia subaequoris]
MAAPLDLDQLQSFCAIADCGSFTEAARRVNKTQSAVSMQIKRLEERLGQTLLTRDGRSVSLTHHGEVLYERARKMLRTNAEILDHFNDSDLAGSIRFGVPDDYAVRLLPVILSSFQRTHPRIAVDVACMASEQLLEGMKAGRYDLIVFTQGTDHNFGDLFRTEKMFWVSSHGGRALASEPLAIACGPNCCIWRKDAMEQLDRSGMDYRVAYTSSNATAISSAVLSDLAIGFLPESALQPGMRVIGEEYGLPRLADAQIALTRASHAYGGIYDALANHIVQSMGNLDGVVQVEAAE